MLSQGDWSINTGTVHEVVPLGWEVCGPRDTDHSHTSTVQPWYTRSCYQAVATASGYSYSYRFSLGLLSETAPPCNSRSPSANSGSGGSAGHLGRAMRLMGESWLCAVAQLAILSRARSLDEPGEFQECSISPGKCECVGFCLDSLRSRTYTLEDFDNRFTRDSEKQQFQLSICDELPRNYEPFKGPHGGGSKGCAGCDVQDAKCTVVHTTTNMTTGVTTCDGAGSAGGGKGVTRMSGRRVPNPSAVELELRYDFDEVENNKLRGDFFYLHVLLDPQTVGDELLFTDVETSVAELNSTGATSLYQYDANLTMNADGASCSAASHWEPCTITGGKCECVGFCLDSLRSRTYTLEDFDNRFTRDYEKQQYQLSICDELPRNYEPFKGPHGGGSKGCDACGALNSMCTAIHTTTNMSTGVTTCDGAGSIGSIGGMSGRRTENGLELQYKFEQESATTMSENVFVIHVNLDELAAGHELSFTDVATKTGHMDFGEDILQYDTTLTMSADDADCDAYKWSPCTITPDRCECAGFCLDALRGKIFSLEDYDNKFTPDSDQHYQLSICDALPATKSTGCDGCVASNSQCTVTHTTTDKISGHMTCEGVGSTGKDNGGMRGRRAGHGGLELQYKFAGRTATAFVANDFFVNVNLTTGISEIMFSKVATRDGENNTGGAEDIAAYDVNLTMPKADAVCRVQPHPQRNGDSPTDHTPLIVAGVVGVAVVLIVTAGVLIKKRRNHDSRESLSSPINDVVGAE